MATRIIPRLEIKGAALVKGIHLEGLRVLGSPREFADQYYRAGADELLYVDVVASLYQRNSLWSVIEATARDIAIPLTVAGGIRSLGDIRSALMAGADKVAINTAAVMRPEFIREAATRFGSSTVVVSIEAKRMPDGSYEAYTDSGRERTGLNALDWARQVAELGAGEILLTSIDAEGTGRGCDLKLVRAVSDAVPIPVIAGGGVGRAEHALEVIRDGRADAIAVSSLLHYALSGNHHTPVHIDPMRLPDLKEWLLKNGVDCRPGCQPLAGAHVC